MHSHIPGRTCTFDVSRTPMRPFPVVGLALLLLSCFVMAQFADRAQASDRVEVFGGYTFVKPDFSLVNPNGGVSGWNAAVDLKMRAVDWTGRRYLWSILNRWLLNFTHNYRNQATALKLPLLQPQPVVKDLGSLPSAQLVPCHPEQREGSMQLVGARIDTDFLPHIAL